jgi:hypothetical protein
MQFKNEIEKQDETKSIVAQDERGSGRLQALKTEVGIGKTRTSSAVAIIPADLANRLSLFSERYGLPFDLGQLSIDQVTPEKIQAMRKLANMISANSKLLPELVKQTKRLMKADISQATANAELAKAQLKHQEKLDKVVADLFISCAQHKASSNLLASKTARRVALIEQRNQLQTKYNEETIYANESNLLDVQYSLLVDTAKLSADGRQMRMEASHRDKREMQAYIDSAFA